MRKKDAKNLYRRSTGFTNGQGQGEKKGKELPFSFNRAALLISAARSLMWGKWRKENLCDRALTCNCFNVTVIMHFPYHSLSTCNFICGGDLVHVSSLLW